MWMKKIFSLRKIAPAAIWVLVLPAVALAQNAGAVNTVLANIKTTLNVIIGLLFVLVTLYFVWGIIQYVGAGGDEEKLKKGRQHMVWGIIGMAIMAAAWGIVGILTGYFGANTTPTFVAPPVYQ